jgi:hypothetical protein
MIFKFQIQTFHRVLDQKVLHQQLVNKRNNNRNKVFMYMNSRSFHLMINSRILMTMTLIDFIK